VHTTIRIPAPRSEPRAFIDSIRRAVTEHRIDLLLPNCEEVFYVSRYRSLLPAQLNVATDRFDKLTALHSKLEFLGLAADCGAKVPDSCGLESLAEAREWAAGRAVVLKPEFSRFGFYVRIYPHGIPCVAAELADRGRWVAQEFCAGDELCSYSIAVEGRLTAHIAYRPTYRLSRSSSFYFDPVHSPAIREFVERFVGRMHYTGQISFDWIDCGRGEIAVLECNPRAISGVHLFAPTDALPAAFTGAVGASVEPHDVDARMITAVMLTAGLGRALREKKLAKWWSDFSRARDVITEPDDLGPLLGNIADIVSHTIRAYRRRCSVREATTWDIEWDGESLPEW
jgi:hypothetical protein